MLTILRLSERPCFICGSREGTAEVKFKDGTFAGVLCRDHAWERLGKSEPKNEKKPTTDPRG